MFSRLEMTLHKEYMERFQDPPAEWLTKDARHIVERDNELFYEAAQRYGVFGHYYRVLEQVHAFARIYGGLELPQREEGGSTPDIRIALDHILKEPMTDRQRMEYLVSTQDEPLAARKWLSFLAGHYDMMMGIDPGMAQEHLRQLTDLAYGLATDTQFREGVEQDYVAIMQIQQKLVDMTYGSGRKN